jgi:type II secretory pathway pseudopilin PulG
MSSNPSTRGFTLFETLIATGVLITALAGIAQLFVLSTQLTRQATMSGAALVSVQDKLESLRGLPFGYDADGSAITDRAIQVSPPTSLVEDVDPYVDRRDPVFVRRWRVSAIGASVPDAIAIEVCAFGTMAASRAADACLSTIRSRQP